MVQKYRVGHGRSKKMLLSSIGKIEKQRHFLYFAFMLFFMIFPQRDSYAQSKYHNNGFPETWNSIKVIADQLPTYISKSQIEFAAAHYAGSQKLTLSVSRAIRRYNKAFLCLHYHLAIWQQSPQDQFIIDGIHWGNDWEEVNRHESWFWHNEKGRRVRSAVDGKYLMNIANPGFQKYWKTSILKQIRAGQYQGVFLDSASVDLLQSEARQQDPRLAGTAACTRHFSELGGLTWSQAYERFMTNLSHFLESKGYAAIPNINGQCTTWDTTDYWTTASGAFFESAFMTRSEKDWRDAANKMLRISGADKISIFQPYLRRGNQDVKTRMYYLACYLLVKGHYSYINYFHKGNLSWFPEYQVDLGHPAGTVLTLSDLVNEKGLFGRRYQKGEAWVNPTGKVKELSLKTAMWQVVPKGGGPVPRDGKPSGTLGFKPVQNLVIPAWGGVVLLYRSPRAVKKSVVQ